jgi:hypothetical protein
MNRELLPESQWMYRDSIAVGTNPAVVFAAHSTPKTTATTGAVADADGGILEAPLPHSVTLRMDFSGDIEGIFVYHCHIIEHEDRGMMAYIQVVPPCSLHKCSKQSTSMDLLKRIFGIDALWGGHDKSSEVDGQASSFIWIFNPIVIFCMVMTAVGIYHCTFRYLLTSLHRMCLRGVFLSGSLYGYQSQHRRLGRRSSSSQHDSSGSKGEEEGEDVIVEGGGVILDDSASALLDVEIPEKTPSSIGVLNATTSSTK